MPKALTRAGALAHRRLARVQFDGFVQAPGPFGELLQHELELAGVELLGFLAEETPTEDVELMAQGRVIALGLRLLGLQRGDQGAPSPDPGRRSAAAHP